MMTLVWIVIAWGVAALVFCAGWSVGYTLGYASGREDGASGRYGP
jgi:hypothetical protein